MASSFPQLSDFPQKWRRTVDVFKFLGPQRENFLHYHVIHSERPEKTVRVISPFLVSKCMTEAVGLGYKATKLASNNLLLELRDKKQYETLSNPMSFREITVTVNPHHTLNTILGAPSDDDLMELTEEELLEGWKEQNVVNVKQMKMRSDGKESQTKLIIFTFESSALPETIEAVYVKIRVWPYMPSEMLQMPKIRP